MLVIRLPWLLALLHSFPQKNGMFGLSYPLLSDYIGSTQRVRFNFI